MPKIEYKLQNVLLEDDQITHDYEAMYVRTTTPVLFQKNGTIKMPKNSRYDFSTYFGSLSVGKWHRYTDAEGFALHVKAKGRFEIRITAYVNDMEYNIAARHTIGTFSFYNKEMEDVRVEFPEGIEDSADVVAFEITTLTDTVFEAAWYTAQVEEERIRPIRINLVMPTFKKEEFVRNNVVLFEGLLSSDDPIAEGFTVSVIDNGRTLGDEPLSADPRIKKFDNPNYGGAGGFARGMIEALHADPKPTHILVMDDDVVVSPESFKRTHALLSIVNEKHKKAFLSGAMVSMQLQDHMVEDVGNVFSDGGFGGIKWQRCLSDINHIVSNETTRFNRQRQYAAFWYCCFPMETVEEQGLTMPFFVRGDDAEFGLRDPNRKFMTMNGICVWHMSFGHSKFNAFNECYLAIRNMLIMSSVVPACENINAYHDLFRHDLETELRKFNYGYCDMMCDAVADYLKGPEWLAGTDPESILKTESSKKPKNVEITFKLPPETGKLYDWLGPLSFKDRAKMKLTHNGHVHCKDSEMSDEPGIMLNEYRCYHPSRIFMHKEIWFVNDDLYTGYKTTIDREKYKEIVARRDELDKKMLEEGPAIRERWKAAHPIMTSEKFWLRFLGLDPADYGYEE